MARAGRASGERSATAIALAAAAGTVVLTWQAYTWFFFLAYLQERQDLGGAVVLAPLFAVVLAGFVGLPLAAVVGGLTFVVVRLRRRRRPRPPGPEAGRDGGAANAQVPL